MTTLPKFVGGWAGLAVVLTGASQLRAEAAPIGPGEMLLAAWLAFVGFLLLRGQRVVFGPVFRVLLLFWLSAALLLALGTLMALSIHKVDWQNASRDAIALTLQALLTCFLAIRLPGEGNDDYYLVIARVTLVACFVTSTVLLVLALLIGSIGPIEPWYGYRFRGWAENPNQMALMVLVMPFLGWYLLHQARSWGSKVFYGLAVLGCVWVGLATASDAARVAWFGSLVGVGFLLWCRALRRGSGAIMYLTHVIVPGLILVLGLALGSELLTRFVAIGQNVYSEGGQGDTRFTAWENGLRAIAQSPLVGLGPGSHSGQSGPFQGWEAHNTLIDWGMSTGMLGVALQLALLTWAAWRAWRVRNFGLVAALVALFLFSIFNYTLRQPIYWLLLVLILRLTEHRAAIGSRQVARTSTAPGAFPLRPARQRARPANNIWSQHKPHRQ